MGYMIMSKGGKEAKHGLESEDELIALLNNKKEQFISLLSQLLPNLSYEVACKPTDRKKCDILLKGKETCICISLKTITNASFHHLDRRWLEDWKEILGMADYVYEIFHNAILRMARNRKDVFIRPDEQPVIRNFLREKLDIILREAFISNETDLKIFAIWDKLKYSQIFFFKIEDLINFFSKSEICFTNKGIIKIGDFITIQRKGGDSSKVRRAKTDPKHPGNMLQFKMNPLGFLEYVRERNVIPYCYYKV
jgi:hypothetical protein